MNRTIFIIILLFVVFIRTHAASSDSIPSGFSCPMTWRIGAEINPNLIPGTNRFFKGYNDELKNINFGLSGDLRADFSFASCTKEGMLYKDLYQGLGVGINSFYANKLLGTPVSVYVYQGAPIVHINSRLWLGYEWQFGAAFGWKHYNKETASYNSVVSTPVTALLGLGVKLHYEICDYWQLSFGVGGTHYSNGNTSWPNGGVNSIGATIGIAYIMNRESQSVDVPKWLSAEADEGRWVYDIMAYGAWRKRAVFVEDKPQMCPGRFGIVGLQFSPLRILNRYVAVGPALDFQWDESAGLEPYWIEGTSGDDIKFERPPLGKQLSVGLSAHAELIMPIFSVNAGIGYDFINPKGEKRFYQSLALKMFLSRRFFLNIGYRLGNFKKPQNLMLGVGFRI